MAGLSWLRGPKPCQCTSPKGYWCTRTDRHGVHGAAGVSGRVYSTWKGDFPTEHRLAESFTTGDGALQALGPAERMTAAEHNDMIRASG